MNDLVKLGLIVAGALVLFKFLSKYQITVPEGYAAMDPPSSMSMPWPAPQQASRQPGRNSVPTAAPSAAPLPSPSHDMQVAGAFVERPKECFPRDQLAAEDLLPKDTHSKWAKVNPEGSGDLQDQSFLSAGFNLGVDTVGQSLRNANYQLRSEPPNARVAVSPWGNSTIASDTNRRAFEIGGDY